MDLIEERLITLLDAATAHPPVYRTQIAAAIYHKNKFVALGHNSYKTHPFQARFGRHVDCIYLHAETDVIKNALKYLDIHTIKKSSLYVARIKWLDGNKKEMVQGLARPCSGCQRSRSATASASAAPRSRC